MGDLTPIRWHPPANPLGLFADVTGSFRRVGPSDDDVPAKNREQSPAEIGDRQYEDAKDRGDLDRPGRYQP